MEEKNKTYTYFVSYHFKGKGVFGGNGFGRITLEADRPILCSEDIEDIERRLKDIYNWQNVVILNYILISENGEEECQE